MAINSWGYQKLVAPGTVWANMQWTIGSRYFVYHNDNVKVTPVSGGTRQVSISPGYFGGWGILDQNTTAATVTLPTVASGTRWFLIIARRTWQTTNATTFTYIDAGTSPIIPSRNGDPGTIDDQPLALVPLTAGNTVPGTPRDLRWMGTNKNDVVIADELALAYGAYVGMRFRLGAVEWSRTLNSAGNPVWVRTPGFNERRDDVQPASSGWGTSYSGWTTSGLTSRMIRMGNLVQIDLRIRRSASDVPVGSAGGVQDMNIFNVNAEWRPSNTVYATCTYINQDLANSQGLVSCSPEGNIAFTAGTPSRNLKQMPAGSWSLSCTFLFIQTGI